MCDLWEWFDCQKISWFGITVHTAKEKLKAITVNTAESRIHTRYARNAINYAGELIAAYVCRAISIGECQE